MEKDIAVEEKKNTTSAKDTANLTDWFYIESTNIFLTPELICGKPCILLLDVDLLFEKHPLLKGKHKEVGFQQAKFEVSPNSEPYLHVLFSDSIDRTTFIKSLKLTQHSVMDYSDTLVNIQKSFYEKARQVFGFRVDVLIQGSIELGVNKDNQKVYSSIFERYLIKPKDLKDDGSLQNNLLQQNKLIEYKSEVIESENSVDFLRATTPESIPHCCHGFVLEAISSKRNVTLQDIKNLAVTLFQKNDNDLINKEVSPYQILLVLNTVTALYIKYAHVVPENLDSNIFDDIGVFRSLCLTHESSPTYPRQHYTDYIANEYNTPLPLSFVMQKVLVGTEHIFKSTVFKDQEDFAILNPMFGYGSLVNILIQRNFLITGFDINRTKVNLVDSLNYSNLSISSHDALLVDPQTIQKKHKDKPIKYVIGSFACYLSTTEYLYGNATDHEDPTKFKFDPISVKRSDFITILDSLMIREDKGRSVYLIPYFNTDSILYQSDIVISNLERTQVKDLSVFLNFINQRYKIESIKAVSCELYSKSLKRISPLILVVGDRFSHVKTDQPLPPISTYFDEKNLIRDYESMWAWANQICFAQTTKIETTKQQLKDIEKAELNYIKKKESEVLTTEEDDKNPQMDNEEQAKKVEDFEDQTGLNIGNTSTPNTKPTGSQNFKDMANMMPLLGSAPKKEPPVDADQKEQVDDVVVDSSTKAETIGSTAETIVGEALATTKDESLAEESTTDKETPTDSEPPTENVETEDKITPKEEIPAEESTTDKETPTDSEPPTENVETEDKNTNKSDANNKRKIEIERLEEIYASYELSRKLEKNKKITSPSSNLFELSERNKIIRYPSSSLINEPKSNVHQKDFSSYLIAQNNLKSLISHFYVKSKKDAYSKYIDTNKLTPNVDSLVSFYLQVGSPTEINTMFTSEHFDLLATTILKFNKNESVICVDSKSLDNTIVSSSLIHINKMKQMKTVVVSSDESVFNLVAKSYRSLVNSLNIPNQNKHITFCFLHTLTNLRAKEIEAEIKKSDVVFILNDVKYLPLYVPHIKHLKNQNTTSIYHENLSTPTLAHEIHNSLLSNKTLFITDTFIENKFDLLIVKHLIPQQIKDRYFTNINGEFDDMSTFLFKKNLIEDLSLLQRFDDLSNIRLTTSNPTNAWCETFNDISFKLSDALNSILILIEQVQPLQPVQLNPSTLREYAMRIHAYCLFCVQSVSLTKSIYDSVRSHVKPIICLPDNIDDIIFDLMERIDVAIPIDSQITIDLKISKFSDLNMHINNKTAELSFIYEESQTQKDLENAVLLSDQITQLNSIRSQIIFEYLTQGNNGKQSKIPNIQSLIALFYRVFVIDLVGENHELLTKFAQQINSINSKISTIVDLPLNVVDFIKYELETHQIISSEISSSAISLIFDNDQKNWVVNQNSPFSDKYTPNNARRKIIEANFNSGGVDVIFVSPLELNDLNFASVRTKSYTSIDYIRKRCLFIVDFNKPIAHITKLITHVQSQDQFLPPEIYCEVSGSFSSLTMYKLLTKQLGLFNIVNNDEFIGIPDLSYFLSKQGQKLLSSYISTIPSFKVYSPSKAIDDWTLFDVVSILSLTTNKTQMKFLKELNSIIQGHLSYLRDSKTNPFDVFDVSPEAVLDIGEEINFSLKLNKTISFDTSFKKPITTSSLVYAKNINKALNMEQCKALYHHYSKQEEKALLKLLNLDGSRKYTLNDLVSIYTNRLEKQLILNFRERVHSLLQNRHGHWIYNSNESDLDLVKKQFQLKKQNQLRISKNLQSLYAEILILSNQDLLSDFYQACRILSFFTSYSLTLKSKTDSFDDLIVLPIQSPFREKNAEAFEGFFLGVRYPTSTESALISKSYILDIAYPTKSKPTKISLKYALEDLLFMKNQSVLKNIDQERDSILSFFTKKSSRTSIKQQIASINHQKIMPFSTLCNMNTHPNKTPIALKFNELSDPNHPSKKVRSMDILRGNLFEIYYTLKDIVPLTMVRFHNENLINEYAFVIAPSEDMHSVVNNLEQSTLISNVPVFLNKLIMKKQNNPNFNYSGFKQIQSIKWIGDLGTLEVKKITEIDAKIIFKCNKDQFALLIKNKYLFLNESEKLAELQNTKPSEPSEPEPTPVEPSVEVKPTPIEPIDSKASKKTTTINNQPDFFEKSEPVAQSSTSKNEPTKQEAEKEVIAKTKKWQKLNTDNATIDVYANQLTITFTIPTEMLVYLSSEISSKSIYNMALVDTSIKTFN